MGVLIFVGELLSHVEQFEKTLVVDIMEANNKLQSTNGGVFNQYKTLLLTAGGRKDLENLIVSIQKGMHNQLYLFS